MTTNTYILPEAFAHAVIVVDNAHSHLNPISESVEQLPPLRSMKRNREGRKLACSKTATNRNTNNLLTSTSTTTSTPNMMILTTDPVRSITMERDNFESFHSATIYSHSVSDLRPHKPERQISLNSEELSDKGRTVTYSDFKVLLPLYEYIELPTNVATKDSPTVTPMPAPHPDIFPNCVQTTSLNSVMLLNAVR